MKTKMIIEILGGNIASISTNTDVDIVIVDRDNLEDNTSETIEKMVLHSPDYISANVHDSYKDEPLLYGKLKELLIPSLIKEVEDLIQKGYTLAALKLYKDATPNITLRDAKDVIDSIKSNMKKS